MSGINTHALADFLASSGMSVATQRMFYNYEPLDMWHNCCITPTDIPVGLLAPTATSSDVSLRARDILQDALYTFESKERVGGVFSYVLLLAAVACANYNSQDRNARGRIADFLNGVDALKAASGEMLVHNFSYIFRVKVSADIQEMIQTIT